MTKKTRKTKYEWYGAKSLYSHVMTDTKKHVYEERIVVFRARSTEEAITLAEKEAHKYAKSLKNARYLKYGVMVYIMQETAIHSGTEVFSLMRKTNLKPRAFQIRYHDTKSECAQREPS